MHALLLIVMSRLLYLPAGHSELRRRARVSDMRPRLQFGVEAHQTSLPHVTASQYVPAQHPL